jgi:hypothetical protein
VARNAARFDAERDEGTTEMMALLEQLDAGEQGAVLRFEKELLTEK